jgi:hypothetical protein
LRLIQHGRSFNNATAIDKLLNSHHHEKKTKKKINLQDLFNQVKKEIDKPVVNSQADEDKENQS